MIVLLVKWEVSERERCYPGIYVEGVKILTETDRDFRLAGSNSYNFCFYIPQALYFYWKFIIIIIIIIIIIMYSTNNFSGKIWAIGGPKLSEPPGDPVYRRTTVRILLYYMTMEQLLEALCYKPEGRDFHSRWAHWNFS